MTTQSRPRGYGIVDENGANSYSGLEIPEATNGHPPDVIVTSPKLNHSLRQHGFWGRFFDQTGLTVRAVLGGMNSSSRLRGDPLEYDTGAGLVQPIVLGADGVDYLVHGHVASLTDGRVADQGADSKTFAATKDTHVYLRSDGELRFSAVNIGVAAAPNADEIHIGTARTNATDVTTWTAATGAAANLLVPVATKWHFYDDALVIDKTGDGGFGILHFVQDGDHDDGWFITAAGASAGRFNILQVIGGATTAVVDFGTASDPVVIGRDTEVTGGLESESLRVVPASGVAYAKFRSRAPGDATDETLHTILLREDFTYTSGAGKTVTVMSGAEIPNNTLINLDVIVTFVDSGSENVATYQKWHVAFKKVGGTSSEVDGGASGEHLTNRPGSSGHQATVVAWAGSIAGVINMTFTAAADGRVCVSGLVQISRYD